MSLASSSFIYFKFHNLQGSVLIGNLNKMNKIAVNHWLAANNSSNAAYKIVYDFLFLVRH